MPTIQYSVGIDHLSVNKLFTSCIRRCLVSRVCDWVMSALSAVLLIFSFQFSLLFSHVDQPGIGRCRKFGSVSCTKRTVQENNFESRFHCKSFSPPPWSTLLCSNLVKLADGKSAKSCVIYRTKKNFARLSYCRCCADRAQNLPGPAPTMYSKCSRFHHNRFTFGGVIAERVNTAKSRPKLNPIFGVSYSFQPKNNNDNIQFTTAPSYCT